MGTKVVKQLNGNGHLNGQGLSRKNGNGADSIDQITKLNAIKEIIFGENIKQYEGRFDRIELIIDDLKSEFDTKLLSATKEMNKNLEALNKNFELLVEKNVNQVNSNLTKKIDKDVNKLNTDLNKQMQKDMSNLNSTVLKQVDKNLSLVSNDLNKKMDNNVKTITKEIKLVENQTTNDRDDLAEMLIQIGKSLRTNKG